MKCKCENIIPDGRVKLGYNSIQIMSSSDAAKIAKMTRRRGYGTMLC